MRTCLVVILLFVILFSSLSFAQDKTYTVENKDGVRIVNNKKPLWDDEPKVALEFVQKIGETDGQDRNYLLNKPCGIVKDKTGNIYILDAGNYRVQVFDPKGIIIKTIERQGEGPGEFSEPVSIDMDEIGNLYVGNEMTNNIIVLNPDSKEISRFSVENRLPEFHLLSNKNVVVPNTRGAIRHGKTISLRYNAFGEGNLYRIYNTNGDSLAAFAYPTPYPIRSIMGLKGNSSTKAVDNLDNIFVSFNHQNRIEKYSSSGTLKMKINREKSYKETKNTELKAGPLPYINIFSFSLDVDSNGNIWNLSLSKQPSEEEIKSNDITGLMEFEIFNSDGVHLGTIPFGFTLHNVSTNNFLKMKIIDDYLYIIDPEYEMCAYEYRIVEK
ncbi:NHL repeat-containing protein [candidate division KSB1 bacterium]